MGCLYIFQEQYFTLVPECRWSIINSLFEGVLVVDGFFDVGSVVPPGGSVVGSVVLGVVRLWLAEQLIFCTFCPVLDPSFTTTAFLYLQKVAYYLHTVSPKRKYKLLSSRVLKTEGGGARWRLHSHVQIVLSMLITPFINIHELLCINTKDLILYSGAYEYS